MADGDIQTLAVPPVTDPALVGVLGGGNPPTGAIPPGYYGGPATPSIVPSANAATPVPPQVAVAPANAPAPPATTTQQPAVPPAKPPVPPQQQQDTTQQPPDTTQRSVPKGPQTWTTQQQQEQQQEQERQRQLQTQQKAVRVGDTSVPETTFTYPKFVEAHVLLKETGGEKDPDSAVSTAGAEGRYQVMPKTAYDYAQKHFPSLKHYSEEDWRTLLMNPETNQYMGRFIINDLWQKYKDPTLVYIGYNAGEKYVKAFVDSGRDPASLPVETRKYINETMTAGSSDYYQNLQQNYRDQDKLYTQQARDLQAQIAKLTAGSPEQRELADQLMKKQIQLMDNFEKMINHPPTYKAPDELKNFGSIATLIGIFAGRFAHAPLTASLNAAGAAIEAMNQNNLNDYNRAHDQWKQQADMTQTLLNMEASTYKGILDNEHLELAEKIDLIKLNSEVFQNRIMAKQAQAGEYQALIKSAQDTAEFADKHAEAIARVEALHAQAEAARSRAQASTADQREMERWTEWFTTKNPNNPEGREPTEEEIEQHMSWWASQKHPSRGSTSGNITTAQQHKNDVMVAAQQYYGPEPDTFKKAIDDWNMTGTAPTPDEATVKSWGPKWSGLWNSLIKDPQTYDEHDKENIARWHAYTDQPFQDRRPTAAATPQSANKAATVADPKVAQVRGLLAKGVSRDQIRAAWITDGGTGEQFDQLFPPGG